MPELIILITSGGLPRSLAIVDRGGKITYPDYEIVDLDSLEDRYPVCPICTGDLSINDICTSCETDWNRDFSYADIAEMTKINKSVEVNDE